MPSIQLTDLKLRVFVDTNVLIDAFITPDNIVKNFLSDLSSHPQIELVTSDYALWEQNEFIRQQTWITDCVKNNRSYKEAQKHSIKNTKKLRRKVEKMITVASEKAEELGIINYNLMDNATLESDFFAFVQYLQINTRIASKDILILLSAYSTQSSALLSRDSRFNGEVTNLELSLDNSLLPDKLKQICFIKINKINNPSNLQYMEWFKDRLQKKAAIGKCINYYQNRVIALDLKEEVCLGNYLLLVKFGDNNELQKIVFQIGQNCLRDYQTNTNVQQGKKVTVALPPGNTIYPLDWFRYTIVFKLTDI
ncbi:hypothetical protein [Emticicia sp. SJ17W-69]|uniref:hypothetical protein n=1 Tax=Emticicia sp. SJ17W-69 TaxID=3421657 RepID=UPI003EB948E4